MMLYVGGLGTMGSLLNPIQRWVWRDPVRRGHRLLRFAEVEADGGRDLARAAEITPDPQLRRLYHRHAPDEQRWPAAGIVQGESATPIVPRSSAAAAPNCSAPTGGRESRPGSPTGSRPASVASTT